MSNEGPGARRQQAACRQSKLDWQACPAWPCMPRSSAHLSLERLLLLLLSAVQLLLQLLDLGRICGAALLQLQLALLGSLLLCLQLRNACLYTVGA